MCQNTYIITCNTMLLILSINFQTTPNSKGLPIKPFKMCIPIKIGNWIYQNGSKTQF